MDLVPFETPQMCLYLLCYVVAQGFEERLDVIGNQGVYTLIGDLSPEFGGLVHHLVPLG